MIDSRKLLSLILTELEEQKKALIKRIEMLDEEYLNVYKNGNNYSSSEEADEAAEDIMNLRHEAFNTAKGIAEAERAIVKIAKENGL